MFENGDFAAEMVIIVNEFVRELLRGGLVDNLDRGIAPSGYDR